MTSLREIVGILRAGWGYGDTAAVGEAVRIAGRQYIRGDTGYHPEQCAAAEVEPGAVDVAAVVAAAAAAGGLAAREAEKVMGWPGTVAVAAVVDVAFEIAVGTAEDHGPGEQSGRRGQLELPDHHACCGQPVLQPAG